MKLQDALLSGLEHGTDRLPVEIDRRMRRRLGLEASPRRVWLRPAVAAFALAAAVVAVIVFWPAQPSETPQRVAHAFVDISKAPWSGTVTGNEIDVRADSPTSATVTWSNATIVAAPGTRMTTTSANALVLSQGAIQIQRPEAKPMFVDVPMGRVVISSYRASVKADRESVTILLDDGTGSYVDAQGQAHPLVPHAALVWPPMTGQRATDSIPAASVPPVVPSPPKRVNGRTTAAPPVSSELPAEQGPPGATIPSVLDVHCTFKSDCAPGATCRKNESGTSVCMGNGGAGAACWFASDCLSQQCTQRRCASAK